MSYIRIFLSSPLELFAKWQYQRWWWITSALVALCMNLIAHYIFQVYMAMDPCEKCVYIRFAMFCIFFGGIIAAISPKQLIFRIIGYILTIYGAIRGAIWSWELVSSYYLMEQLDSGGDPFAAGLGVASCSTEAIFPFNIPLDVWFPEWFQPTGVCGADNWSFGSLDMGSWTLIIFSVYLILVLISFWALWVKRCCKKQVFMNR